MESMRREKYRKECPRYMGGYCGAGTDKDSQHRLVPCKPDSICERLMDYDTGRKTEV